MTAIIFDTETTGRTAPEIIEAAWLVLNDNPASVHVVSQFVSRYKPSKSIDLGAMATHHIMEEDLVNCAPSSAFGLPVNVTYLIGHNIDFDWEAAGKPNVRRICTMALAKHCFPTLDSHTQSAVLYHLDRHYAQQNLQQAHSAAIDVQNNLFLLKFLLLHIGVDTHHTWEDVWKWSEEARVPKVISFGKHKGTPIEKLPKDYVGWLLRQEGVDPYLVAALKKSC
jgi:exodeoxyribonuclease X